MIDTTNTPHYNVVKFHSNFFNLQTLNDFTLRDSFEVVEAMKAIPKELFSVGYRYVSFDVESSFTKFPLKKTVNILLKRVNNVNQFQTSLKKRFLKKLIHDSCTKTTFSFNNEQYEQTDGVSMG